MDLVQDEISHFPEYEYVVINKNLKETVGMIMNIIKSERLKKSRLINLTNFVNKFRGWFFYKYLLNPLILAFLLLFLSRYHS